MNITIEKSVKIQYNAININLLPTERHRGMYEVTTNNNFEISYLYLDSCKIESPVPPALSPNPTENCNVVLKDNYDLANELKDLFYQVDDLYNKAYEFMTADGTL